MQTFQNPRPKPFLAQKILDKGCSNFHFLISIKISVLRFIVLFSFLTCLRVLLIFSRNRFWLLDLAYSCSVSLPSSVYDLPSLRFAFLFHFQVLKSHSSAVLPRLCFLTYTECHVSRRRCFLGAPCLSIICVLPFSWRHCPAHLWFSFYLYLEDVPFLDDPYQ